jgi:hypothetical protein
VGRLALLNSKSGSVTAMGILLNWLAISHAAKYMSVYSEHEKRNYGRKWKLFNKYHKYAYIAYFFN